MSKKNGGRNLPKSWQNGGGYSQRSSDDVCQFLLSVSQLILKIYALAVLKMSDFYQKEALRSPNQLPSASGLGNLTRLGLEAVPQTQIKKYVMIMCSSKKRQIENTNTKISM